MSHVVIVRSDNIASTLLDNTTAQLTAPSDKQIIPDFQTGRISDDTTSIPMYFEWGNYTELEWSLGITIEAAGGDEFEFRIVDENGTVASYGEAPIYTYSGEAANPIIEGTVCWGQDDGVEEDYTRNFDGGDWEGTGAISGTGNAEQIVLDPGEYVESYAIVHTGAVSVTIQLNKYGSGDSATVKYQTGADVNACLADSWHAYSGPFDSSGYVRVRIENPA